MTLRFSRLLLVSGVLAAAAAGVSAQDMTGAGATFPAPIYAKWADAYNKATGARLNYQSVGSGAGIQQIRAKTVDFGASDMPLTDEALAKDGLIQFPDRDRRRRPGGQHQGHRPGADQAHRPGARRHLPRQDHEVE